MLVIQGEDPSVFLDGVRALLVTHCFLLSDPGRELGIFGYFDGAAAKLFGGTPKLRHSSAPFSPSWPVTQQLRMVPEVSRNTVSRMFILDQDPDVARPVKRYRITGVGTAGKRCRPETVCSLPTRNRWKMLILLGSGQPMDEVDAPPNLCHRSGVG